VVAALEMAEMTLKLEVLAVAVQTQEKVEGLDYNQDQQVVDLEMLGVLIHPVPEEPMEQVVVVRAGQEKFLLTDITTSLTGESVLRAAMAFL
jgi:hypothetical protein